MFCLWPALYSKLGETISMFFFCFFFLGGGGGGNCFSMMLLRVRLSSSLAVFPFVQNCVDPIN